jgi:hypothetical protein
MAAVEWRITQMELTKEAFHKWANSGKTLVAYGPRDEGGYSLLEYNVGQAKELVRSDHLEEIQAAFRDYYIVKAQAERGMPWKVAGNHLVICREAPDGKFEVREYNSFKNRIEMPLERCDTLKEAREALEKYAGIAKTMTGFNSLTERQHHFEYALSEARYLRAGKSRAAVQRQDASGKTVELGR